MQPNQQRILAIGLNVVVLILLLLTIYVWLLPQSVTPIPEVGSDEAAWWGVWPVKVASGAVFAGAILMVLGAMVTAWWFPLEAEEKVRQGDKGRSSNLLVSLFPFLVSALFMSAFFLFPVAHTRWGDAYILSQAIGWPDEALRLTHSWQAPLDVFVHGRVWLFLSSRYEWIEAVDVYRLLSPIAGLFFLAVVVALSHQRALAPSWLTFGLLSSLGLMQLFFGYIENYSFAAAGILAYLWLGIGVLRGEKPLWLAVTVLALTNATHPSTVVLAPSLLYCGWCWVICASPPPQSPSSPNLERRGRPHAAEQLRGVGRAIIQIAVPMIVVAGLTILLMELGDHGLRSLVTDDRPGGGDGRWLVPLFETTTRWEHYTMFSWPHLRDFLNEQLLVVPVVLPSLVLIGLWSVAVHENLDTESTEDAQRAPRKARENPNVLVESANNIEDEGERAGQQESVQSFLLIAAGFYLLFTWMWNPDYGGQRDWDLFSLAALPTTLLLSVLLSRLLTNQRWLAVGAVPLIIFQALHTLAWLYQNTLPWQWPD